MQEWVEAARPCLRRMTGRDLSSILKGRQARPFPLSASLRHTPIAMSPACLPAGRSTSPAVTTA